MKKTATKMKTGGTAKKKYSLGGVSGDPILGKKNCKMGKCGPAASGTRAKSNMSTFSKKKGKGLFG
jgi:hypothetical protein